MRTLVLLWMSLGCIVYPASTLWAQSGTIRLSETLAAFDEDCERILDPAQRGLMNQVAWKVARLYGGEDGVDLALVDLDNSTISQLAEVWLNMAFLYYNIGEVRVISGGLKADGINVDALQTLTDWGFGVEVEGDRPVPMLTVDYGQGQWNLLAKNIDPERHADLTLFVDDHCETELHADVLERLNYVRVVLGTSPGCLENGEYQYEKVNREIAAKMFYLVKRLEINLLQQRNINKQRKDLYN